MMIEWFKNRFTFISGIWINEKNGNTYTTVKLKDGRTATVSHKTDVTENTELGILWAYTKAQEVRIPAIPEQEDSLLYTYQELIDSGWDSEQIKTKFPSIYMAHLDSVGF